MLDNRGKSKLLRFFNCVWLSEAKKNLLLLHCNVSQRDIGEHSVPQAFVFRGCSSVFATPNFLIFQCPTSRKFWDKERASMNVGAYYRISTTDQRVDLQRDAVRTLCERHNDWHVTEYVDSGVIRRKGPAARSK